MSRVRALSLSGRFSVTRQTPSLERSHRSSDTIGRHVVAIPFGDHSVAETPQTGLELLEGHLRITAGEHGVADPEILNLLEPVGLGRGRRKELNLVAAPAPLRALVPDGLVQRPELVDREP